MTKLVAKAKEVMKFLIALAGVAANLIAIGVVPSADVKWVTVVITAITAVSVYFVPNAKTSTVAAPSKP